MTTRKWWIIGGVAVLLLCMGCGVGAWIIGRNAPDTAKPRAVAETQSATPPPAAPSSSVPEPSPAAPSPSSSPPAAPRDDAAYLAGLREIDPGLVASESRALRRAEETCADIKGGLTGDALATRVVARLSGGNATINTAQARRAIALMQAHICR